MKIPSQTKTAVEKSMSLTEHLGVWLKRKGIGSVPGGRLLVDFILWPSDYWKCVKYYKGEFHRRPKIFKPETFNEKIQHHKLFHRKRQDAQLADKLAARDFITERVGTGYLPALYWTGTHLLEAREQELPDRFVIKANHSWETVILVPDRNELDWEKADQTTRQWLKDDHSMRAGERQYRWIEPRLYIEEYLGDPSGKPPADYKFFCFQGSAAFFEVDFDLRTDPSSTCYDRDFNRLPFFYSYPKAGKDIARPVCLDEMIRIAETLSAGRAFLRVDLYNIGGKPFCGELAIHPGSGFDPFDPPEYDRIYGDLFNA